MKIQVFTRCFDDFLFNRMREFIPDSVQVIKCTQFNSFQGAADYLYYVIDNAEEYAINIDIDCFIYSWDLVLEMIAKMKDDNIFYSGMPDGGVHPGRSNSWANMNPFFNIFNAKKIRERKEKDRLSWELIARQGFNAHWERKFKPKFISDNYNHNSTEPFAGFFYWLFANFEPMYHKAHTDTRDNLTSYLFNHKGDAFCCHTWYSRAYHEDSENKARIDNLYLETVKKIKY